jgi:predicted transcriptional regulator
MSEVLELNQAEIRALLDLIEFHDDWDEVSEIVGVDVSALYDKVSSCVTY